MEAWRRCITQDDVSDPVEVVVAELSEYFKLPPDEVRQRCIHWEEDSVKEWQAKDRTSSEALLEFYQTQVSWIFDTMWYHANQYHGKFDPESVKVAAGLQRLMPGHHLDFGAGPGTSSLFFHELGWQVSLADISTTFQDFARWRFAKHNVPATFYETSIAKLPTATYDLITAFDVMVHVPNVGETLADLRRTLKPGGYLVFNIDSRPRTETTEWHLYDEHYPILRLVRAAGFGRHPKIDYFYVFQKVERGSPQATLVKTYDQLRYNPFTTKVAHQLRKLRRP